MSDEARQCPVTLERIEELERGHPVRPQERSILLALAKRALEKPAPATATCGDCGVLLPCKPYEHREGCSKPAPAVAPDDAVCPTCKRMLSDGYENVAGRSEDPALCKHVTTISRVLGDEDEPLGWVCDDCDHVMLVEEAPKAGAASEPTVLRELRDLQDGFERFLSWPERNILLGYIDSLKSTAASDTATCHIHGTFYSGYVECPACKRMRDADAAASEPKCVCVPTYDNYCPVHCPDPAASEPTHGAEDLAQQFHETYERLAPIFGYETRRESAKPWAEVPEQNRKLMTAVCAELIAPKPAPPTAQARPTKYLGVFSQDEATFLEQGRLCDACQLCNGSRGGIPGNENIVRGVTVCDYCSVTISRFEKQARPVTREQLLAAIRNFGSSASELTDEIMKLMAGR